MSAKEHYEHHLAAFYPWMCGDLESRIKEFRTLLNAEGIRPGDNNLAIDLGAGHGIQSMALAREGFRVKAVDFNQELLSQLQKQSKNLPIQIYEANIVDVERYGDEIPALIVCWGDTLTHLENKIQVFELIRKLAACLTAGAKFLLSFRDYSRALPGEQRFIPVKSDENRILTCVLDYETDRVRVTDLLHEKQGKVWQQKVSFYYKVRLTEKEILDLLLQNKLKTERLISENGLISIIAIKV